MRRTVTRLVFPLSLLLLATTGGHCPFAPPLLTADHSSWPVITLPNTPNLQFDLLGAFLTAAPGTVIELPAGTFQFNRGLILETSHIEVRGQGMYSTILDFTGQTEGAQGILVRDASHFTARDFAILNPAGDGIKTEGTLAAPFVSSTFERVRVEWTGGPDPDNGDYGLYPAHNKGVIISNCIVKGARDAGIYVGQSLDIVVRWNLVEHNVLGIEVENSIDSDVYGNLAMHNTAGIAIFNLPNLQRDGLKSRVFDNVVIDNNTYNFAAGGILAMVPPGSGILNIGHDEVEIYNNVVGGNKTVNVAASSFQVSLETITDPTYDPWVESVHIHHNVLTNGGYAPDGILGLLLFQAFQAPQAFQPCPVPTAPCPVPDIVVGGWVDPAKLDVGAAYYDPARVHPTTYGPGPPTLNVRPENRICIHDNPGAVFGSLDASIAPPFLSLRGDFNAAPHDCSHTSLAAATLDAPLDPPPPDPDALTPEEIAAICDGGTPGQVNWAAVEVACPLLSDYGLFMDPGDATTAAVAGGVPFDLVMPLFSDYAEKFRYVFVPPGEAATWSDSDPFDFPVGTIIAKTFAFRHPVTGALRVVETRLLQHRVSGWEGIAFIWDDLQTDAALALGGGMVEVVHPQDENAMFDYWIPNVAECGTCHFGATGDDPIGPKARLLNKTFDYAGGTENQIDHWTALGILSGAPVDTSTIETVPPLEGWETAPGPQLDLIAQAYLESNCAHCHNPMGRAGFTGMHLTWGHPFDTEYGFCKRPVAAGSGALGLTWDIDPGNPDQSILIGRVESVEPSIKMPEIEKNAVHWEGADMLRAWVLQVTPDPSACLPE